MSRIASHEANVQAESCGETTHLRSDRHAVSSLQEPPHGEDRVSQRSRDAAVGGIQSAQMDSDDLTAGSLHDTTHQDQPGWSVAELCMQCAAAKQRGDSTGWCNMLKCAFIRGYDTFDELFRVLCPFTAHLASDKSENAKRILPLFIETEQIAAGLLWRMSATLKSIVPFQTAENAFTNKRIPPGTHKPTIMSAFQALGRMISLFVENEGDADMISAFSFSSRTRTEDPMRALHHALSSSSSASHSSPSSISSPPAIARTRGECSECFSEGVTLRRVKVFAQRAQEWLNGDCPVMRGCDAASVATLSFLAIVRSALSLLADPVSYVHEICEHRFPEVRFKKHVGKLFDTESVPERSNVSKSIVANVPLFFGELLTRELMPDNRAHVTIQIHLTMVFKLANLPCHDGRRKIRNGRPSSSSSSSSYSSSSSSSSASSSLSTSSSSSTSHMKQDASGSTQKAVKKPKKKKSKAKKKKKKKSAEVADHQEQKSEDVAEDSDLESRTDREEVVDKESRTDREEVSEEQDARSERRGSVGRKSRENRDEHEYEAAIEERREITAKENAEHTFEEDEDRSKEDNVGDYSEHSEAKAKNDRDAQVEDSVKESRETQSRGMRNEDHEKQQIESGDAKGEDVKEKDQQACERMEQTGIAKTVRPRAEKKKEAKRVKASEIGKGNTESESGIEQDSTARAGSLAGNVIVSTPSRATSSPLASSFSASSSSSPSLPRSPPLPADCSLFSSTGTQTQFQQRLLKPTTHPGADHVDEEEGWVVQRRGKGKQQGRSSVGGDTERVVQSGYITANIENSRVTEKCSEARKPERAREQAHGANGVKEVIRDRATRQVPQNTFAPAVSVSRSQQRSIAPPSSFPLSHSCPPQHPPLIPSHTMSSSSCSSSSSFPSMSSSSHAPSLQPATSSSTSVLRPSSCVRSAPSCGSAFVQPQRLPHTCRDRVSQDITHAPGGQSEEQREEKGVTASHTHGENNGKEGSGSGVSSSRSMSGDNMMEDMSCVVCMEAKRTMCFWPCRHVACCERCVQAEQITVCPLCSANIETSFKVFV